MYCPSCGRPSALGQKFCTSCGHTLDTVTHVLADQVVVSDSNSVPNRIRRQMPWLSPLIYSFFLILLGIFITGAGLYAFNEKSVAYLGEVIAGLGALLLFMKGMSIVMVNMAAEGRSSGPRAQGRAGGLKAPPQALLRAEPPSVVESTTRHLEIGDEAGQETARNTQPGLQH